MTSRPGLGALLTRNRFRVLTIVLVVGGLALAADRTTLFDNAGSEAAAAQADRGSGTAHAVAPIAAETVAFPLMAKPGQHYLEDAAGRPFLIHGDTAWSLIAELTREEVEVYLDDRRARGFNTILVSLIEHRFATKAPANAYGDLPFGGQPFQFLASLANLLPFRSLAPHITALATQSADYSKPNEDYFRHADWVLQRAADKGILVLLTASYLGWKGGNQGWYQAMVANGPDRLRQYGEYLGRRYRDFPNIMWVHGGDYNAPRKDLVRAIAEGITKVDPRVLHTAHTQSGVAAIDYWHGEPWLRVNTIYSYKLNSTSKPIAAAALEQYAHPDRLPFFLIETAYEYNRGAEATEQRLRTQAYQAVLSGAAGQVFGNNPIWHFDGPGLYPAPVTWEEALNSRGAQSMTYLRNLLADTPWWRLAPDADHTLLTNGLGAEDERAVAASTPDGSLAIAYLPSRREITIDLTRLAGPRVAAQWYDPADGQFSAVQGSPFPATARRGFAPAPRNSSGFADWVLILESVPIDFNAGASKAHSPPERHAYAASRRRVHRREKRRRRQPSSILRRSL